MDDIPVKKVPITFVTKDVVINTQDVKMVSTGLVVMKLAMLLPSITSKRKNSVGKIRSLTDRREKGKQWYDHDNLPSSPHGIASEKLITLQINISRKAGNS
jgi:hypothetical protein